MLGLKAKREEHGFSRAELAARVGATATTIWRYEAGKRSPDLDTLILLSAVLGCTIDFLVNDK